MKNFKKLFSSEIKEKELFIIYFYLYNYDVIRENILLHTFFNQRNFKAKEYFSVQIDPNIEPSKYSLFLLKKAYNIAYNDKDTFEIIRLVNQNLNKIEKIIIKLFIKKLTKNKNNYLGNILERKLLLNNNKIMKDYPPFFAMSDFTPILPIIQKDSTWENVYDFNTLVKSLLTEERVEINEENKFLIIEEVKNNIN